MFLQSIFESPGRAIFIIAWGINSFLNKWVPCICNNWKTVTGHVSYAASVQCTSALGFEKTYMDPGSPPAQIDLFFYILSFTRLLTLAPWWQMEISQTFHIRYSVRCQPFLSSKLRIQKKKNSGSILHLFGLENGRWLFSQNTIESLGREDLYNGAGGYIVL